MKDTGKERGNRGRRVSVPENGFAYWQSVRLLVTVTSPI
jgi:hypothetical protein